MSYESFEDLENSEYNSELGVPFQYREDKSKQATLEWLKNDFNVSYRGARDRFIKYKKYNNYYANTEVDENGYLRTSNRDRGPVAKKPKIKVNFFYEYVTQRVSQVSRTRNNVALIPRNQNEQKDINNSKTCKLLLKTREEEIDLDRIHREMDEITYIYGHSFMKIIYDAEAGPVSESYQKSVKTYGEGKIPELDEAGKPTGKYIKGPVHIGDATCEVKRPYEIFPERGKVKWEKIDYLHEIEWMHIKEAEAKYPEIKGKTTPNAHVFYDFEQFMDNIPTDMILIRCFYHKPTKFFPEGCKIIYCDDMIISWEAFPYKDAKLPYIQDKDISIDGKFWGESFFTNVEQLINMYSNMTSTMARNHGVMNAPKYAFPKGTIDKKSLHNEFGSIEYTGAQAPQVLQHNYVNRGEFELQDRTEKRIGRLAGVFEISQGIIPPGITAASAIRYLDEQEQQRISSTVANRKRRVLDVYRMMVSRFAQFYRAEDGRLSRLLGPNNDYLIESFKEFDFNQIYDVRYENIPYLSDTITGKIADIIDLNAANQKDPLFGKKEMAKILHLGLDEAFRDETTYAVDCGRSVLDMILMGKPVPAPTKQDGLIEYYLIFSRFVESIQYKMKLAEEIKQKVDDYILALEMLMWDHSQVNPMFMQQMMALAKYPIFFAIPAPVQPPMPPQGQPTPATQAMDTSKMTSTGQQIEQEIAKQGEPNA